MALKKSQLYASLWQGCDELRGGMDASQYKDYVLTLLFIKYVSDKYARKPDALLEVPAGAGFSDVVRLKGDKEIGDKINKIIGRLANANDLRGVIDQADFCDESKLGSGKEMQDRLSKLVSIFDRLDFRSNRAEGDDLLGDAYEYLMRHFATESGKSKGQFYTPAEVSRVMAQVVGVSNAKSPSHTIYDPTCGSGSLLLKAADQAPHGISVYGQERDVATWALARMNMILHGHPTAEIWRGNTLTAPGFKNKDGSLRTFDFAVANPPFSDKAWSSGLDPANDEFGRFEDGIPPAKNGDYAFLLHLVRSLKSTGKGAIILPHGVLFRGNREADIRRNLVQRGLIKGIIGLPGNLFYGTGIPACVLVIDKENAHVRSEIFIIDASRGFIKDGNKNRLREQDIHKIVDVFNRQIELPRYSRVVPVDEISSSANDYNLNIPRYIDATEPEDLHSLDAHLNGGIPNADIDALGAYWEVFPGVRDALFRDGGRPGYSEVSVGPHEIRQTILRHEQSEAYMSRVHTTFEEWCKSHEQRLLRIAVDDAPRALIEDLSERLLASFTDVPLVDTYDVYQRLMDYWFSVMQDDVYLIASDGWLEAAKPRAVIEDSERKIKESPDLVVGRRKYKMDLLPPGLLVARYFSDDQAEIESLNLKRKRAVSDLEEFVEENSGEEGPLEGLADAKGKVTKTAIKERLKAYAGVPELDDERNALARCLELLEAETEASRESKDAQAELNKKVLSRYAELSEAEVKNLVVRDKWFAGVELAVKNEITLLIQELAGRVKDLDDRYNSPLPGLECQTEALQSKVEGHLQNMGIKWL